MKKAEAEFLALSRSNIITGLRIAIMAAIGSGCINIFTGLQAIPPVYPTMAVLSHMFFTAVGASGLYLFHELMSNSQGDFMAKEPTPPAAPLTPAS